MLSDIRITANDVHDAEENLRLSNDAWKKYGRRIVSTAEIEEADKHIREGRIELLHCYSPVWIARRISLWLFLVLIKIGLPSLGSILTGLIAGTVAVVISVVPIIAFVGRQGPIFLCLAAAFILGFAPVAIWRAMTTGIDTYSQISRLQNLIAKRSTKTALLRQRLRGWREHLYSLQLVKSLQERYERAEQKHTKIKQLLQDRRYQLVHSDWRTLRGIPFEKFIAEIFTELGFSVQETKATGDQGVDLIVKGKQRVLAIQCKGYANSVGNGAIQEVFAGMRHYQCHECAVITNSGFTSGAVALAQSVGCKLLDEQDIPKLIEGMIF